MNRGPTNRRMVDRDLRRAGRPKYSIPKLIRLAVDGLVSFSDVPLRLASVMGFAVSGLSVVGILVVLAWRATGRLPSGAGLATIALSILFLGGVQLLTAGILGENVGRIFEEGNVARSRSWPRSSEASIRTRLAAHDRPAGLFDDYAWEYNATIQRAIGASGESWSSSPNCGHA